jgi:two-component system cell cycle sensor histidine kinase/response regulator CckA
MPLQDSDSLRQLLATLPGSLLALDEAGTIHFASAGSQTLFCRPPDQWVGLAIQRVIPGFDPAKENASDERRRREAMGLRPDGSSMPIEIDMWPLVNSKGRFVIVWVTDLSNRRSHEEWFRLAIEAAPEGMILVDARGKIVYANSQTERIFGYSARELLGSSLEVLLPKRFRERHVADRVGFHHNPRPRPMGVGRDLFGLHRDGHEIQVEIGLNPLRRGDETFVLAAIVDIGPRKALEARLIQAQKLESLGVLASGIAHDFNNLLTGILGYADLALLDLSPVSSARESISNVITGAHDAAELVRQMLAYTGKSHFETRPIRLSDVVEEMSHLLRVSISKKCVLHHQFELNLPEVEGDPAQIRQVIMNLITNASDAIGERSGTIAISTGATFCDADYLASLNLQQELREGLYVFLEVSDTGCGMTDAVRSRIFDPFFTTKVKGRGLGLSAVLGIVRSHHGAVKIYSEPGRGTTFKVLFPASAQAEVSTAAAGGLSPEWKGSGTVLVADDEETVRSLATSMLKRMGFDVVLAEDGRQALEIYTTDPTRFRLVILDMTMPHLNGAQTFRELRRISHNVRVVLSSGYSETSVISQFAGKGLAGFLAKPYRYEELSKVVHAALQSSPHET